MTVSCLFSFYYELTSCSFSPVLSDALSALRLPSITSTSRRPFIPSSYLILLPRLIPCFSSFAAPPWRYLTSLLHPWPCLSPTPLEALENRRLLQMLCCELAYNKSFISFTERQEWVAATGNDVDVRLQYNQLSAEFRAEKKGIHCSLTLLKPHFYPQSLPELLTSLFSTSF